MLQRMCGIASVDEQTQRRSSRISATNATQRPVMDSSALRRAVDPTKYAVNRQQDPVEFLGDLISLHLAQATPGNPVGDWALSVASTMTGRLSEVYVCDSCNQNIAGVDVSAVFYALTVKFGTPPAHHSPP